jgi:DNA-binding beta-propeller fold protein YncE
VPRSATPASLVACALLAACGGGGHPRPTPTPTATPAGSARSGGAAAPGSREHGRSGIYAHARAGMVAPAARHDPRRVYVPNSDSDTVDVISQRTGRRLRRFAVGDEPQHVVPAWDLRTLWVVSDRANLLTPIDPVTGRRRGRPIPVADPYNLYFTPDGRRAIVVAERLQRLDFRTPHRMRLRHSLQVACAGVDHLDFTRDGRRGLASCEFAGRMVAFRVRRPRVLRYVELRPGAMPQDVRLSPDGRTFYVADMASGGVWLIDAWRMRRRGFIRTGPGAHGIYPSRDGRFLYVSNRGAGTISVVDPRSRRVRRTWQLPGGGSPDMGGVSADGRTLWLTGRYNAELYAIRTRDGKLLKRIPVGLGPHGAAVWPQPGRHSLGHTGNMR